MLKTLARCAWMVAVTAAIGGLSTTHASPVGPIDIYGNLGSVSSQVYSATVGYLGNDKATSFL